MIICERLQYNAALAVTVVHSRVIKNNLYLELGIEYLSSRRRFMEICWFYKIVLNKSSDYLCNYISTVAKS